MLIDFDRLVPNKSPVEKHRICSDPISADPICPFPSAPDGEKATHWTPQWWPCDIGVTSNSCRIITNKKLIIVIMIINALIK